MSGSGSGGKSKKRSSGGGSSGGAAGRSAGGKKKSDAATPAAAAATRRKVDSKDDDDDDDEFTIEALTRRSLEVLRAFNPTEYLLGGGGGAGSSTNGTVDASNELTSKRTTAPPSAAFRSRNPVVKRRRILPPRRPESFSNPSSSEDAVTTATVATRRASPANAKSGKKSSVNPKEEAHDGTSDPDASYSGNYLYGIPIPPPPLPDVCGTCHKTTEPPECKEDVLLCDGVGCGREFHLGCCVPPLMGIPEGTWLCHDCSSLGSTASLRVYFDKMKARHDQSTSRVENLLSLIIKDAEQVNITKSDIPVSELERANVYHTTALQAPLPPGQPSSSLLISSPSAAENRLDDSASLSQLGRDFFLGKPLRLYDDVHDHFHTGRIVDFRQTCHDNIPDFEYLVRFGAGSDDRKASASYWIALEEHNLSIGTTIVQLRTTTQPAAAAELAPTSQEGTGSPSSPLSPTRKRRGRPPTKVTWVPAMVWLRTTRALLSLYGINPEFPIFTANNNNNSFPSASESSGDPTLQTPAPAAAKGKSPASSAAKTKQQQPKSASAHKRQLWAAVCPFGSQEIVDCDLVSQTADFAATSIDPDASPHEDDRVRFLNWLAMAEVQAQERVRQWHALPLRNQFHNQALTFRDEDALGPLVPVNYSEANQDPPADPSTGTTPRHAELCPLVSPGLDRTRLLQIAKRHHPDGLDLNKDVASTLACRIVSLSDMEATQG